MNTSHSLQSLTKIILQWKAEGARIAFVPTMGHLHAGHIELVKQARLSCDKVLVSIFVNPLQFNDASDFSAYPKTLEADQKMLRDAQVDALFLPDSEMMYPAGSAQATKVCVPDITLDLEGEHRPGHFDGVSTVVNKLCNLVQPQEAFFGEKDYQQLLLIQKMVADLNMPIKIQPVATYREDDGLAMSSRNSRLTMEHRAQAPQLHRVLQQLSEQLVKGRTIIEVESAAIKSLNKSGFNVEYVSVRNAKDLKLPAKVLLADIDVEVRVLAAAWLGDVRLIDNISIGCSKTL